MTPNLLGPYYGVWNYNSAEGAHKLTHSLNAWSPGGAGGYGQFIGHDDVTMNDASDIAQELADLLKVFQPNTASWNSMTVYYKPTLDDPSVPVSIIPLTVVGTATDTTQHKATMSTWSFRTTLFGKSKLVLLDAYVGAGFEPTPFASWGANDLAIFGALSDLTKPYCGRDGAAIGTGIRKTYTMSDVLERRYGMS
jgi:hypothetical protein